MDSHYGLILGTSQLIDKICTLKKRNELSVNGRLTIDEMNSVINLLITQFIACIHPCVINNNYFNKISFGIYIVQTAEIYFQHAPVYNHFIKQLPTTPNNYNCIPYLRIPNNQRPTIFTHKKALHHNYWKPMNGLTHGFDYPDYNNYYQFTDKDFHPYPIFNITLKNSRGCDAIKTKLNQTLVCVPCSTNNIKHASSFKKFKKIPPKRRTFYINCQCQQSLATTERSSNIHLLKYVENTIKISSEGCEYVAFIRKDLFYETILHFQIRNDTTVCMKQSNVCDLKQQFHSNHVCTIDSPSQPNISGKYFYVSKQSNKFIF
jgi:hypothetical protein